MVDKIQKALNKFSNSEKQKIKIILLKIKTRKFTGLDAKKLKGRDDIYRIRKGKIRIIYIIKNGEVCLLTIERRSDKTYKNI
ncbi:MAG: hypothetical protein L3J07_02080 [Candidatus Magasanikbacteria bacterium]|nr:hypothetical protein [Candidatus Magasanikbacteria bacterium]